MPYNYAVFMQIFHKGDLTHETANPRQPDASALRHGLGRGPLKDGKPERYNYAGYAAQAGTNVMGNLSIRF